MAAANRPDQGTDWIRDDPADRPEAPHEEGTVPYSPRRGSDSFFLGPGVSSPVTYGSALAPRSSWAQLPSGLNLLAGIWLLLSPMLLYPSLARADSPAWNDMVAGVVVALLALVRLISPRAAANLGWVNAVVGSWLILSPFVLSNPGSPYPRAAWWNEIVVGLLVVSFGVWSAVQGRRDRRREGQD